MPVSHNPCALVQAIREELAQPGTSCCLMHPCAFNIGFKAVDGNDASISGFVLALIISVKYWEANIYSTV
jgi:hypothetical protein